VALQTISSAANVARSVDAVNPVITPPVVDGLRGARNVAGRSMLRRYEESAKARRKGGIETRFCAGRD
jgi:hypothetical protein